MAADRSRLAGRIKRVFAASSLDRDEVDRLVADIDQSIGCVKQRRERRPKFRFDGTLPIAARIDEIADLIAKNQVVIVCGETGSGKTTQLPLICLKAGRGVFGVIAHTQPRRIAARTIAARIAGEMGQVVGDAVGYQVRFTDKSRPDGYLKVMTDGILLAETHSDPRLSQYDTIIVDEAHERSLNIDFLLGFLKKLLQKRADLKVIVTSATIDAARFSDFFDGAPVIEVSGRLYPVEIRYRGVDDEASGGRAAGHGRVRKAGDGDAGDSLRLPVAVGHAVDEAVAEGEGDILVFLPGEREIRETAEHLRKHHPPQTRILPLYARQSADEQRAVFESSNARKIILSTNVAETSLTVPGIRFVVDTGLARVKRYSYRQKVEQLHVEKIAKASANQRAGRCGRVSAGVCFRLYDEADFNLRPDYADPEIFRSSLAGVILKMITLKLGDIEDFDFIDRPWPKMIADGYRLLTEIGALDDRRQLTAVGRKIAGLPLDPKIARILLASSDAGCLSEMLILCAALSVQDPRERPMDQQAAADLAHRQFADSLSECVSWLKLWRHVDEMIKHRKSNRKLVEACKKIFLSYLRLREWRDVHQQLLAIAHESRWRINETAASVESIVSALLTGFLGHIGMKTEEGDYLGVHGLRFRIHPSSTFRKKSPKWIVATELVETTRLFARTISEIKPEWIEAAAGHLVTRQYLDPHWEQSQGRVVAYERVSLYGLVIVARRPVHYGPIDPKIAREIFIRSALVEGNYRTNAPFWAHNQAIVDEIEQMEHRSRRQDILVDDETRYHFYDSKIPADVTQKATFEKWRKTVERDDPEHLFFTREDLMRHDASRVSFEMYPATLTLDGVDYDLSYWHEPGSFRDGVTLTLPLSLLNQIPDHDWLVAGLLKEKVRYLCKSLPQRFRSGLIPLPAFVDAFVDAVFSGEIAQTESMVSAIVDFAKVHRQVALPADAFDRDHLPEHLKLNHKLVDEAGHQLAMSRDLDELRAAYGSDTNEDLVKNPFEGDPADRWVFPDLPESIVVETRGRRRKTVYPAVTICEGVPDRVRVELYDAAEEASVHHRAGLVCLLKNELGEQSRYLLKMLSKHPLLYNRFSPIGSKTVLQERLLFSTFDRCFLSDGLPRTRAAFELCIDAKRAKFIDIGVDIIELISGIVERCHRVAGLLKTLVAFAEAKADIENQLAELITEDFWLDVSPNRLAHYGRYLQAIVLRVEKLRADPTRDARLQREFAAADRSYRQAKARLEGRCATPLDAVRWALEELRVSLFAQEIKTPYPISVKRIEKMIDALK